jgi:hypothetical protein
MRAWIFMVCLLAGPAYGQTQNPAAREAAARPPGAPCVDVGIGAEPSYDCLNAQLLRAIPPRRFSADDDLPLPANVPAPAAGLFNEAATAEQLGSAFGHATQPQRPPPTSYPAPLLPTR